MEVHKISWPGWENIRMIGRGNYGAVYEIQRNNFGMVEKAALKRISIPQEEGDLEEYYNNGYDEESLTEVFQSHLESVVAEYSLMRKMNGCVNIVNCDDILYEKHEDGIGWNILIRMELLTPITKSLTDAIAEETVYKVARDMCTALIHCKELGIVHRDIKPQNIFVSRFGDYKLGDFGIAKTVEKTMGGTKIGTYNYMAPEVYMNQPYGAAVDIYSLGLVLYWMLNEKRMPFMPLPPEKLKAGMDEQSRSRRLSGEPLPPPAHGSEKLKRIVLKACAFDPKDRYQTAAEMLADLNVGEAAAIPEPPKPPVEYHPAPVEERKPEPQTEPEDAGDKTSYLWAQERTEKSSDQTISMMEEQEQKDHKENGLKTEKKRTITDFLWAAYFRIIFPNIKWMPVIGVVICFIIVPRLLHNVHVQHIWSEATCTTAKTCLVCGKANGNKLEHQWEKAAEGSTQVCINCGVSRIRITRQPDDVTVESGTIVLLSVEAVGDDLTYQWYYNPGYGYQKTAQQQNCSFSMYEGRDGWTYYCVITDKYGNSVQTDIVTVRLKDEPLK